MLFSWLANTVVSVTRDQTVRPHPATTRQTLADGAATPAGKDDVAGGLAARRAARGPGAFDSTAGLARRHEARRAEALGAEGAAPAVGARRGGARPPACGSAAWRARRHEARRAEAVGAGPAQGGAEPTHERAAVVSHQATHRVAPIRVFGLVVAALGGPHALRHLVLALRDLLGHGGGAGVVGGGARGAAGRLRRSTGLVGQ